MITKTSRKEVTFRESDEIRKPYYGEYFRRGLVDSPLEVCLQHNYPCAVRIWNQVIPSKRIFMLNGVELPSPIKKQSEFRLEQNGEVFYFSTSEDMQITNVAILHMLIKARDDD